MRNLRFPLKVHCWGGLGSQLFGVLLYLELKEKFPRRRILLCLHQGGVTLRNSEIGGIFQEITINEIRDFSKSSGVAQIEQSYSSAGFRNRVKQLLIKLKVVLTLDDSIDFKSIKHWTLSIRGHYSYRRIQKKSYELLISSLTKDGSNRFHLNLNQRIQLGVHYRLGDLLELSSKRPMELSRLIRVIEPEMQEKNFGSLTVFSDSPDKAVSLIKAQIPHLSVDNESLPTWETIGVLSRSEIFVGTFSKISLWVVIVRYFSAESLPSFMPIESLRNLKQLLGEDLDSSKLRFYR
jgi:hypothetical protein